MCSGSCLQLHTFIKPLTTVASYIDEITFYVHDQDIGLAYTALPSVESSIVNGILYKRLKPVLISPV